MITQTQFPFADNSNKFGITKALSIILTCFALGLFITSIIKKNAEQIKRKNNNTNYPL